MFVLKIVWRKSIASLHRLTQDVQRANLRRTAGDPTWVWIIVCFCISNGSFRIWKKAIFAISSKLRKLQKIFLPVFFCILKEPLIPLERTIASTETNNSSNESSDTYLFGARRTRSWQCQEGATPTCQKSIFFLILWTLGVFLTSCLL
jgi:hypothetical protein